MTSRAEGWKRVFLIVLHTMWRWGLTWTFLPFSKMKWMYLVKIQPLRWGSQSRWLCQSSYFLKSHRESPLREKLSLSLMLLFSETQNFSPSHRSSHLYILNLLPRRPLVRNSHLGQVGAKSTEVSGSEEVSPFTKQWQEKCSVALVMEKERHLQLPQLPLQRHITPSWSSETLKIRLTDLGFA